MTIVIGVSFDYSINIVEYIAIIYQNNYFISEIGFIKVIGNRI